MARVFLTRTQNDQDDEIAAAIISREAELANYDLNQESLASQLLSYSDLEQNWPEHLLPLKNKAGEQQAASDFSDDDIKLAARYSHRDRLWILELTNHMECQKSENTYNSLLEQLPAGTRRDAAIARVIAKQNV